MANWRILVVDDELLNLHIITDHLDDPDYQIDATLNAEAALDLLQKGDSNYDLIILDRIMPGMDGLELLQIIKSEPRFKSIPVVMQTAAATAEELGEGIAAGAYYYLAKPYDRVALRSIVRAALLDRLERQRLVTENRTHCDNLKLLVQASFRFATLSEAQGLAQLLGALCPEPEAATMGLAELLINAIEHGNLGVGYEAKKQLKQQGNWENEITRRQQLPESRDRFATLDFERTDGRLMFRIADQGAGFHWQAYLDFDPSRAADPNGRGIAMARLLAFSTLQFEQNGRVAVASVEVSADN